MTVRNRANGSRTGPAFDVALYPNWPNVTPFMMERGDQFHPAGPRALGSARYLAGDAGQEGGLAFRGRIREENWPWRIRRGNIVNM
jgi:hypothetical protein